MDQHVRTQSTFTLEAGPIGVKKFGKRLVRKSPFVLIALVLLARRGDDLVGGAIDAVLLVGGALAVVAFFYWIHGFSTIEVTPDEVVLTRLGVRRRRPRDQITAVIGGVIDYRVSKLQDAPETQWAVLETGGRRFFGVDGTSWPSDGFHQLADALGLEARRPENGTEHAMLKPWAVRKRRNFVLVVVLAGIAVGLVAWGVIVAKGMTQDLLGDTAGENYTETVEPKLTTSRYPHLTQTRHGVPTSPLSVSGYTDNYVQKRLRAAVGLEGTASEAPASEVIGLLDVQCDYSQRWVEVHASVTYDNGGELGYDRIFEVDCAADRSDLEDWAVWAEENLGQQDLLTVVAEQRIGFDDEPREFDLSVTVPDTSDETFVRVVERLCTYPAHEDMNVSIHDEDFERSFGFLWCGDPLKAEW